MAQDRNSGGSSSRGPGQRKGRASQMGQQPEQGGPRGQSDNTALQDFGESLKSSPQRAQGKDEPDLGRGTPGATQHGQQMFEKEQPGQTGQGTTQGKGHQGQQAHSKSQSSAKRTPGAEER